MKSRRWIWIVTLLFYCSGCTAYAPVYLPGDTDAPPGDEQPNPPAQMGYSPGMLPPDADEVPVENPPDIVKKGMWLRVTLRNGERVSGELVEITDDALVFGTPGNYGLKKEYYLFLDIAGIEVSQSTGFSNFVSVFLLVSIGTLVGLALALAATIDGDMS